MNSRNQIQDELVELNSALPANLHKPVFGLPEGYFENFASSVLDKLKEDALSATDELSRLSPLLASVSKKPPFSVPENYFTTLSEDLPSVVGEESLPPIFSELDRKMPFEVPNGYFEGFAQKMVAEVAPKEAKVISMRPRFIRMAAAAVVIGIISVAGFFYVNRQNVETGTDNWVANNLQTVSDQELEEFVNGSEMGQEEIAQSGASQKEVSSLLNDVSTNEMDEFLAQVPTDDEELLIIN